MAKKSGGFIPKSAAKNKQESVSSSLINISLNEANMLGVRQEGTRDSEIIAHVNLKYYDRNHECFSIWEAEKLRDFSAFIEKISMMSWAEIYKSAGSTGYKTGLGYTPHPDKKKLPNNGVVKNVSEDITLFELRVNREARVHGFRTHSAFFLVWLDKDHSVYPRK